MENNSVPLGQESTPGNGAAELRTAIAQARLVFEGIAHAEQALDYLELVMASNIARSCVATMSEVMLVLGGGQQGALNQPQARIDAATLSAVPARPCASATTASVGKLVLEVDASQLDAALVKVGQLRLALSKLTPD